MPSNLDKVNLKIVSCIRCDRLVRYCQEISSTKKRMYINEDYWGKPVPSLGDHGAEVLIIGLAPAAHGANRTGRMFTGDMSGAWLFRTLNKYGFANSPDSSHKNDGLVLQNVYISSIIHCAPPNNKPFQKEVDMCLDFLVEEMKLLKNVKVVVALGKFAFDGYYKALKLSGYSYNSGQTKPRFGHGARYETPDGKLLISSFHPSRQNTQTGRLTREMFDSIFDIVTTKIDGPFKV